MRTVSLLRSSSESDESGCESDCSSRSSMKKVHFCEDCKCETDNYENSKSNSETRQCTKNSCKIKNKLTALKIGRGDIPDGSDVFRQVLKEIQTEDSSDDEMCTPRSDCDTPSKPLKSILKKHKRH